MYLVAPSGVKFTITFKYSWIIDLEIELELLLQLVTLFIFGRFGSGAITTETAWE